MTLPTDPKERKNVPMARGFLDYFPDAIAAVANVSRVGNEQHNPGQPMHWNRDLSTDHADCLIRHLVDRGKRDTDGLRHSAKVAWRALALLQTELEEEQTELEEKANQTLRYEDIEPSLQQRVQKLRVRPDADHTGGFDVCAGDIPTTAFRQCDHCQNHLRCQSIGECHEHRNC